MAAGTALSGPPALSSNPGNLAIFPAKGQSPEQQRADESAAYDWATKQTGWDPYQAKAVLDQQTNASAAAAGAARGGAIKGGAGGAALGAAIGAVAGDAGGDRERPTFLRVDAEKKSLTILAPASRKDEVTKLDTVQETGGAHVFCGIENGRIVSLVITPEGRMTLSIVGDGVVWSVFGHALPE